MITWQDFVNQVTLYFSHNNSFLKSVYCYDLMTTSLIQQKQSYLFRNFYKDVSSIIILRNYYTTSLYCLLVYTAYKPGLENILNEEYIQSSYGRIPLKVELHRLLVSSYVNLEEPKILEEDLVSSYDTKKILWELIKTNLEVV